MATNVITESDCFSTSVHGKMLGPKILAALGIPKKGVFKVVIECEVGKAVTATIHKYVIVDSLQDVTDFEAAVTACGEVISKKV